MKSKTKEREKVKNTKQALKAACVEIGGAEKLPENDGKTHKSRKKKAGDPESITNEATQCKHENESKNQLSDVVPSGKRKTDQLSEKKQKRARKDEPKSVAKEIIESVSFDIAKEDTKSQSSKKSKAKKKKSECIHKENSQESTIDLKENVGSEEDENDTEIKHKKKEKKMEGNELDKIPTRTKSKMERKRKLVNEAENEFVVESDSGKNIELNQSEEPTSKKKKKRKLQNIEKEAAEDEENKTVLGEGGDSNEVEKTNITESKKSKKKKRNEGTDQTDETSSDPEQKADKLASEYLHQWSNNRESWKFQKVRQVWLLKNMYSENKVTKEDFTVLLSYLDGMKGRSREVTVEQAEKIIEEDGDKDEVDQVKIERARQIVQLLT
ncbi:uncharacterized protein LOC133177052 [Saccostrea echinata]|uniref:uncharacterized protein LOC133177052 n=1 Tax=Saccostrea echinata TaxID=191078 RepID=UPI002A8207F2|nr:uncharacterized protein LOC133177052 [Saccostrea echinata]